MKISAKPRYRLAHGALCVAVGIRISQHFAVSQVWFFICCILLLLGAMKPASHKASFIWLVVASFTLILLGSIRTQQANIALHFNPGEVSEVVEIQSPIHSTSRGYWALVESNTRQVWKAYFHSIDSLTEVGSKWVISGDRQTFSPTVYPFEFNSSRHYASLGISGIWYVSDQWKVKDAESVDLRCQLIQSIENWPVSKRVSSFYRAMLTGDKSEIEPEDREAFVNAGLVHVLAVSGLHVGLVVALVNLLMRGRFFHQNLMGLGLKWIVSMLALWTFVYISGSGPSVVRAALMFSTIQSAKLFRLTSNTAEAVWASAFVVLLIRPLDLYSLGFQLSYLAVFGIVYGHGWFQQKGLDSFVKHSLLKKAIAAASVSFWAQAFTSPLTLFYFHVFPKFFLISNLIFLPLIPVLLVLGLVVMVLNFWISLPNWLWGILEKSVQYYFEIIHEISKLPGIVFDHIYLAPYQVVVFLLVLPFLIVSLWYRNKWTWWATVSLFFIGLVPNSRTSRTTWVHGSDSTIILEEWKGSTAWIYAEEGVNLPLFLRKTDMWRHLHGINETIHVNAADLGEYHMKVDTFFQARNLLVLEEFR